MKVPFFSSPNFLFWAAVSLLRSLSEAITGPLPLLSKKELTGQRKKVAVLLPCYNEEVVLPRTIASLKALVPAKNIFVISDLSTDRTVEIARAAGCSALPLKTRHGKARALEAALKHFRILKRFQYVVTADADAIFGPTYLRYALSLFRSDPDIAAIAGHARTPWQRHWPPNTRMFFNAYRTRLYRLFQWIFTYGWTWRPFNVTVVVPGFASIYRASVLQHLDIYVPGLLIEDFGLAFQIQKKKLGRIAYHPLVYAVDQEPDNLNDYVKQIRRWNIGFWQTVRHYGLWPSLFWVTQGWFLFEALLFAVSLILMPLIVVVLTLTLRASAEPLFQVGQFTFTSFHALIASMYGGLFGLDYFLTIVVALKDKRYLMLWYGLGFIFIRMVDSFVLLTTLPEGLFSKAEGIWQPPTRYRRIDEITPHTRSSSPPRRHSAK